MRFCLGRVGILLSLAIATMPSSRVWAQRSGPAQTPDVVYIPTPTAVVNAMLDMAHVGPTDVVYDLGSGDGRIPIAAVKTFDAARAVGIDLDPARTREAVENARLAGVGPRARFVTANVFAADLHEATVVTLYMSVAVNLRLKPKLLTELKKGSRIVSHVFDMGDWAPTGTRTVNGRMVYLWVVQ
jgi:precorrin-6B methylase 2